MTFVAFGIGAATPSVAENVSGLLAGSASRSWIEAMGGSREAFLLAAIYIIAVPVGGPVYAISTMTGLLAEEIEKTSRALADQPGEPDGVVVLAGAGLAVCKQRDPIG